jgi:hypothetical protein
MVMYLDEVRVRALLRWDALIGATESVAGARLVFEASGGKR